MLLSVFDQRSTVDLASDSILHHLPSVELQTGIRGVYAPSRELCGRDETDAKSSWRGKQIRG